VRRSTQEASPYSLLQLAGPSPLQLAAGPPTSSLSMPPPSPFFAPFPPAAAALYQAGLLVNMYAAAAAAFSAASGAPCPDVLSPQTSASVAATSALDVGHIANRADPSLLSPGNDRHVLKAKFHYAS